MQCSQKRCTRLSHLSIVVTLLCQCAQWSGCTIWCVPSVLTLLEQLHCRDGRFHQATEAFFRCFPKSSPEEKLLSGLTLVEWPGWPWILGQVLPRPFSPDFLWKSPGCTKLPLCPLWNLWSPGHRMHVSELWKEAGLSGGIPHWPIEPVRWWFWPLHHHVGTYHLN